MEKHLRSAIQVLIAHGHQVSESDIPGLYWFDGREVTRGQILDIAAKMAAGNF